MKIAVIGTGNVGVAFAADLSIKGHEVTLLKTSSYKSDAFERLIKNGKRFFLKEKSTYTETVIKEVSKDLSKVAEAEVIFCTIQSNFYEGIVERIHQYLHNDQIVVCICSYASSFYFEKHCRKLPMLVEATGPYLEGRVELNDKPNEVVFRVGCRLERCPFAASPSQNQMEKIEKLRNLCNSFNHEYSMLESALLNPNMVLHTVGSIMSLSRIEYSKGNFCMYREAYTRNNKATLGITPKEVMEQMKYLKEEFGMESIVEEYIAGSDCTVTCINNQNKILLCSISIDCDETNGIQTRDCKVGFKECCSAMNDDRLMNLAGAIFHYLGLKSHARIDFRKGIDGRYYPIDINLLPGLGPLDHLSKSLLLCKNMSYIDALKAVIASAN